MPKLSCSFTSLLTQYVHHHHPYPYINWNLLTCLHYHHHPPPPSIWELAHSPPPPPPPPYINGNLFTHHQPITPNLSIDDKILYFHSCQGFHTEHNQYLFKGILCIRIQLKLKGISNNILFLTLKNKKLSEYLEIHQLAHSIPPPPPPLPTPYKWELAHSPPTYHSRFKY